MLPDVGPVYSVSVIPTGRGQADIPCLFRKKMRCTRPKAGCSRNIIVSLGGRVAEEIIFQDITTGASQDIRQATDTARAMVTRYGMSEEIGLINYDNDGDEVFIGRDLAHSKPYGENTASAIDREVKKIIDNCHNEARRILTENIEILHACANLLIEREKINRDEFEALFSTT